MDASTVFLPSPPHSPLTHQAAASSTAPRTPTTSSNSLVGLGTFGDPFAANSKATQSPPSYHQRYHQPRTPDRVPATSPRQQCTPPADDVTPPGRKVNFLPSMPLSPFIDRSERALWDEAIDKLILEASGEIDLQNKSLTYIPPSITDAANLVVLKKPVEPASRPMASRAFDRVRSAPATSSGGARRSLSRAQTTLFGPSNPSAIPAAADLVKDEESKEAELQLLLSGNLISKLPNELFQLRGLTVLSLRNNRLKHIPPAISVLVNLEELNLANNGIRYLPSEIILLNLKYLSIIANPLLSVPTGSTGPRLLSPLTSRRTGVRSLQEIALSVLLAPSTSLASRSVQQTTKLQEHYRLPLPSDTVPAHFTKHVNAALPNQLRTRTSRAVTFEQLDVPQSKSSGVLLPSASPAAPHNEDIDDAALNARFNRCPSSLHQDPVIFVDHAEERLEWINDPADVVASDLVGGFVPILWRGCTSGCLSFLDRVVEVEREAVPILKGFVGAEEWDEEFVLDP